jgi:hypothetical protein
VYAFAVDESHNVARILRCHSLSVAAAPGRPLHLRLENDSSSTASERGRQVTYPEIFKLHPQPTEVDREAILRCINDCLDCAASCIACADACLSEDDVADLVRCIRLDLDCADDCNATARIVLRQTTPDVSLIRTTLEACAAACLACGEECARHAAHHEHCRLCADVCSRCKRTCDDLLTILERLAPA